ncbi:MAG: AsmA family protein, partial [Planctomycetota bacterium]
MARHKYRKSILRKIGRWLIASLILTPILWFFYIEAGRALSYLAIRHLAKITNTNIKTKSIEFQTDGSVFIEQLAINPKKGNGHDTILQAEKVYACFNPASLLLLRPRLKVMDIENFDFNAQYDLDTGWSNLSGLTMKPPKGQIGNMPRITLKNGTLQYSKISKGQSQIAVSIPLDASFGLEETPQEDYKFEITTATTSSGYGKSRLTGYWKPGIVTVTGGISSIDIPELEMAWFVEVLAAEFKYDRNNDFSLILSMPDLQSRRSAALDKLAAVGPAFLGKSGLFTAVQGFLDLYQPQGLVDIRLEVSGNMGRLSKSKMTGKVQCKDVEIGYYKFPYSIEHLVGQIDFTKNSVVLNNLRGKHGDVDFFFNGWARDFGPDRKYQVRITSDNMPLDNDLYEALNTKQKKFWTVFSPAGHAGVDLKLSRQSQDNKETKLELQLLNTEAVYRHFPYPLENLAGKLLFNRDKIIFSDIVSQINERKITVNGLIETSDTDSPPTYDFIIKVNNIPIDAELKAALTEKQQNLYEQLSPAGLADGWIKISAQGPGPAGFT